MPDWLWPENFHPSTDKMLASPDTGAIYFDVESFLSLQELRNRTGPLKILSGYRTEAYNARVSPASRSQHFVKIAFDIVTVNYDYLDFERKARAVGFTGIGRYPDRGFMHVDMGPVRTWYGSQRAKKVYESLTQGVDVRL